ncbi:hypothetical protein [Parasphingorhabdus halotolerans]|uniref:Uncharacterized protein n=1 Tax=Parasphingorhabdus halotolerans TaxID=2725558 RepID=A0A6H2DP24_9SPHN|nr:hypothetical protein [Parasphingorhabdus halotolerans]QJB69733.1 hypothetical protein HF685_10970 [Parasphingorhabdus halotolerans]
MGYSAGKNLTAIDVVTTYPPSSPIGNHGNTFVGFFCGATANGALDNTLVGTQAGLNLTTGMDNCLFGINTMQSLQAASENAAFGHASLRAVVGSGKFGSGPGDFAAGDGHQLSAFGDMAGRFINGGENTEKTGGRCSVYIGARTKSSSNTVYNENVFGFSAEGRGSNTVSYGDANITAHHFNAGSVFAPNLATETTATANLRIDPATGEIKEVGAGSGFMIVQHRVSSGTNGGDTVTASWVTRPTVERFNGITGASVASSQFTLPAGTYKIDGYSLAFRSNRHKARLYNVTDSSALSVGEAAYTANADIGRSNSVLSDILVLTGTKTIELQHYTEVGVAATGLGAATGNSTGDEIYASVTIEKIA